MNLPDRIRNLGYVGERKALALLCLGFYTSLFTLFGLLMLSQLPEWAPCFLALAACYAVGFFALGADWFWGRWFAGGLGYSGVTMAGMSILAAREVVPQLVVFGVMHGIITLAVMGEQMAARYEAREEWRKRWGLDEEGVLRIRRSVTRAATSLPGLILFALAPREAPEGMLAVAVASIAVAGLAGVLHGRTWGVLALGGAGAAGLVLALRIWSLDVHVLEQRLLIPSYGWDGFVPVSVDFPAGAFSVVACCVLLAAAAAFARPVARWLRA